MLTPSTTDTLAQATAVAAIVTMLIGILRPFIEQLPFARPSAPTHDATLRLLNLLLNVGGVLAIAAVNGGVSGGAWLALTIQALAQASGSHILFHSVTSSSATSSSSAATATSAPLAVGTTYLAPHSATDPLAPLSAATATDTTAAQVAAAVQSAVAAQTGAQ